MSILTDATLIAADSGGLVDLANGKMLDLRTTFEYAGYCVVGYLLLKFTLQGGFTFGKLLINGVLAGFCVFLIGNPDFFADKAETELNGAPPAVIEVHHDGDL